MARPITVPRQQVVRRMTKAFRAMGYDGASLANLANETGLAKAALYHHFPGGKESMAAAVLDDLRCWVSDHVLTPLAEPGDPRAKLVAMARAFDDLYSGGSEACLIGLFSAGEARAHFQDRLRGALKSLIDAIGRVVAESGLEPRLAQHRAEDAIIRIQGALVVARALQDHGPFKRVLQRLPDELLARDSGRRSASEKSPHPEG